MAKRTYPEEVLEAEAELEVTEDVTVTPTTPAILVIDQLLPYARQLQGTEASYDFSDEVVEGLVANGLAAKTENGLVRGYKHGTYFL